MKPENQELSTADLARAGEDVKGTGHEDMKGLEATTDRSPEAIAERPPAAAPPSPSPVERDREKRRIEQPRGEARTALFADTDAAALRNRGAISRPASSTSLGAPWSRRMRSWPT
jgi:hypothetical protein